MSRSLQSLGCFIIIERYFTKSDASSATDRCNGSCDRRTAFRDKRNRHAILGEEGTENGALKEIDESNCREHRESKDNDFHHRTEWAREVFLHRMEGKCV